MGRNKKGMFEPEFDALRPAAKQGNDPWKRQRKERTNHSPSTLQNVDVHGILFAVVAVVFGRRSARDAAGPLREVHAEAASRVRREPRRGPRGAPRDALGE